MGEMSRNVGPQDHGTGDLENTRPRSLVPVGPQDHRTNDLEKPAQSLTRPHSVPAGPETVPKVVARSPTPSPYKGDGGPGPGPGPGPKRAPKALAPRHQPWRAALIEAAARKAKAAACKGCGATIVTGLDGDRCAFTATADLAPLTWAGEIAAWLDGRATFELAARELWWRTELQRQRPAEFAALPEHRCRDPIPDLWITQPTSNQLRRVTEDDIDKPAF